ncbi:hypothetical protein Nepgr_022674 [Nepenthes gracilis]|uniref:Uncharacterized protein n=1 Tax=Nepenthes gracilis TaxID=150966 RepID=A0AAD3XX11_NEPGR|nr:hypothetical protein Nepgr_022674 [Nepenthes gracilis]
MDVHVAAWGPKSQGVTPLHLAAEGGHLKVMDVLLQCGADIDTRTKGACGSKERNKEVMKYLIKNWAFLPPETDDSRFNPPLHYCSGLEWAYEELKPLQQQQDNSPANEASCSSKANNLKVGFWQCNAWSMCY